MQPDLEHVRSFWIWESKIPPTTQGLETRESKWTESVSERKEKESLEKEEKGGGRRRRRKEKKRKRNTGKGTEYKRQETEEKKRPRNVTNI